VLHDGDEGVGRAALVRADDGEVRKGAAVDDDRAIREAGVGDARRDEEPEPLHVSRGELESHNLCQPPPLHCFIELQPSVIIGSPAPWHGEAPRRR
jgi:hypothetical protein